MRERIAAVALALLVCGCEAVSSYSDAKKYQMSGGAEKDIAEAERVQAEEKARRQQLDSQAQQRRREIEANERRITAARNDLDEQNRKLTVALNERKLSAARHASLKRQLDTLSTDLATLDKQMRADQTKNPAASPDPEKLRKLKELEARKKELENALAIAVGR
jgi:septal ring factor EnvC (AmiA/AmiB activator)